MSDTFYGLSAQTPGGKTVDFSSWEGHPVLVVNTATQCGLTPQFDGLEMLHQRYKDQGLVVVGFPCNQFGGQEPLSNDEMEATCKMNHGVTFPLMAKIDVNGPETHPVFRYLKKEAGGLMGDDIKWNFTKFLISKDGQSIRRYAPTTVPADFEADVVASLK
ncbi:MAG: glutathione peroxidase [Spirochaetales bacterium]